MGTDSKGSSLAFILLNPWPISVRSHHSYGTQPDSAGGDSVGTSRVGDRSQAAPTPEEATVKRIHDLACHGLEIIKCCLEQGGEILGRETMDIVKSLDVEDIKIDEFPYKGEMRPVTGISVRWLSRVGGDGEDGPEYGLRLFTSQPGGEIPIHKHFYHQTMYIISGQFECWRFDPENDELLEKKVCGPGDSIYIPSMEPHGMRNVSGTEPATFLCAIANVYEDE
jgi:quercetin dioxygenase-like cupin family protein